MCYFDGNGAFKYAIHTYLVVVVIGNVHFLLGKN
jgi:hypothetical protein